MGGSRIFDWGGPHNVKARDVRQNVALFALKSWPIGGGHGPVPPPGTALVVHYEKGTDHQAVSYVTCRS